jgi:uncharacterized protein (TIGR03503 family)
MQKFVNLPLMLTMTVNAEQLMKVFKNFRMKRQLFPKRQWAAIVLLCGLIIPTAWAGEKNANDPVDDVRVLIDISGSMKRTDPNNLRRPALRLFTSLLPRGAEAGVWTFGQWTNMLVKHGPVNGAWKDQARKAADDISSHGLRTNIEDVMRRATWDWKRPDASHRRSLILLTDGLVDISKTAAENNASRERILHDILPRLQQADATLHTIALSTESDATLLEQLAAATGGRFETIDSADGLERLFLRMFEKVSKADTLPLEGNKVSIDNSIHEATFLVFRKPGAKPTSITPPKGKEFDQKKLPADVEWHREERYDLVTVQDPAAGEWLINADVDPDNRVMVVTDLHMKNTELPNELSAGRPLLFTMQLEQDGKTIDRPDFLQFVKATLTQVSAKGEEHQWRLRDDGQRADLTANDGIFSTGLKESLLEGEYEFILDVDGTTFKRNQRQQVRVLGQPVKAQLEPLEHNRYALTIVPYVSLIDTETMHVSVEHVLPSGQLEQARATKVSAAEWRLELDVSKNTGKHELTAFIRGQDSYGNPLDVQLGPIQFESSNEAVPQHVEPMRTPIAEPAAPPVEEAPIEKEPKPAEEQHSPEPEPGPPTEDSDEQPMKINWGIIIGLIIGLSAMLSGLIYGGIKLWPKIKARLNERKEAKTANKKEEAKPAPPPPAEPEPAEAEQESKDESTPDLDEVIDELLTEDEEEDNEKVEEPKDSELDPEFDLSDEEPVDAEDKTEELSELPADLLSPDESDSDAKADTDSNAEKNNDKS